MADERIADLERESRDTVTKVAVLDTKFGQITEGLMTIKDEIKAQTQILSNFVAFQEKHHNLANLVSALDEELHDKTLPRVSELEKFKTAVKQTVAVFLLLAGIFGFFGKQHLAHVEDLAVRLNDVQTELAVLKQKDQQTSSEPK